MSKLQQQIIFDIANVSMPLYLMSQPSLITLELYLPSSGYDKNELVDALKLSLSERIFKKVEKYESSNLDGDAFATIYEVTSDEDLLLLIERNQIFTRNKGASKIMIDNLLSNTDLSSNTNKGKQQPNALQSLINAHESGGTLIRTYKIKKHVVMPTSYLTKLRHDSTDNYKKGNCSCMSIHRCIN